MTWSRPAHETFPDTFILTKQNVQQFDIRVVGKVEFKYDASMAEEEPKSADILEPLADAAAFPSIRLRFPLSS